MDRFDPFVKYADVYGDIINWEKDPMNKPQNQNKYFFSDGKTYYEQICKMLRLMSVFKEAFNQIYSNEDEISEAWENFVNNLSASVVEGSEPDVTLTWTDDSVNFEFTMVPGVPGEQGIGITSISFNSDYTMTITLSDGNSYTSMSLKGETGPQGPQGETGSGLQILDVYATLADLQSAHPTGQPGDAYQVGSEGNYILYIWSSSQSAWVPAGSLGTVSPSVSNPLMDGTASAGSSDLYSRGDHVHPTDTSRASKEELDALIKTSQALIDQSFTYRESPAIQDGLARIDKIKGNTLGWNQLVQNGNFADDSNWVAEGSATINSITNNTINVTTASAGNSGIAQISFPMTNGHQYLLVATIKTTGQTNISVSGLGSILFNTNSFVTKGGIFTWTAGTGSQWSVRIRNFDVNSATFEAKNVMLFDLTAMFGSGNEPTTIEDFTSLFPLPYYAYNQGTLLSFNGNGIKTTGKNLINYNSIEKGRLDNGNVGYASGTTILDITGNDISFTTSLAYRGIVFDFVRVDGNPFTFGLIAESQVSGTIYFDSYDAEKRWLENSNTSIAISVGAIKRTITISEAVYVRVSVQLSSATSCKLSNVFMGINIDAFEPYTSSTLSLPISTYFPTGMKSAGSVYDELTPTKAVTRIGAVDMGTMTWVYDPSFPRFQSTTIQDLINKTGAYSDGLNCAIYKPNASPITDQSVDKTMAKYINGTIYVVDRSFTNATEFTNSLQGVYLYYELATSVETSISPELDLSFMSYMDGTEQLLPVNGSVPATSPVIANMTYLSIDDAMEYVLEKLANVPQNTQQILESLEDDVSDLQTDVGALQPAVSSLQTSVGNINTNIGQLSSTVAGHTSSISDMQSDISDLNTGLNNLNTGLNDLEDTVTDNTSRIGTLETGLTNTNNDVDAIDARVLNLETDLLKIVKKEYDYDSVAGNTNFGVQTGLSQETGYKIIGIVGSEVQQGEYTSAEPWIIVTQAHVHYTSTGGLVLSMMARNVSEYTKTNVRVYLYLLCIKDTRSE